MMDNKPRSKVVLDKLSGDGIVSSVLQIQVEPPRVANIQEWGEHRRSGRVVRQPEYFIGLGEIPEELEMDPSNYNEVI